MPWPERIIVDPEILAGKPVWHSLSSRIHSGVAGCIVSIVGAWTIVLYFTGWKHAGENIADVLKQRARELPAPIQMCDALSRNRPKLEGVEPLMANCLTMEDGRLWKW